MFAHYRKVVVPEERLEVATERTNCGPDLMAQTMTQLARATARPGSLSYGKALDLVT
jgi:hypothetical protein